MEYEVVYEISKFQLPIEMISCLFMVLICGVLLVDYLEKIISGDKRVINFLLTILLVCIVAVGTIMGFSTIKYGGSEKRELSKLYYSGNYSVAEGVVYDLVSDEISQEYYVDDVFFQLSRVDETIWDIEENGQQVRICYIPGTEENAYELPQIVKLEIKK